MNECRDCTSPKILKILKIEKKKIPETSLNETIYPEFFDKSAKNIDYHLKIVGPF